MDEKEQKLLDFLLADFNALKSEIARRSNLQRVAIAALLALYAWAFNMNPLNAETIVIAWVAAILAATFVYRESREISRLGWTIKDKVATQAEKIIGADANSIIPSEAHASKPRYDSISKLISGLFAIVVFLIVPLYLTAKYYC